MRVRIWQNKTLQTDQAAFMPAAGLSDVTTVVMQCPFWYPQLVLEVLVRVFGTSVLGKSGLTSLQQPPHSVKYDPTDSVKSHFHLDLVKSPASKVNGNILCRLFFFFFWGVFFVFFLVYFPQTHPHNSTALKVSAMMSFGHFI